MKDDIQLLKLLGAKNTWQTIEKGIQWRLDRSGETFFRVRFKCRTYPVHSQREGRALLAFLREFRRDAPTQNVLGHPVIHLT